MNAILDSAATESAAAYEALIAELEAEAEAIEAERVAIRAHLRAEQVALAQSLDAERAAWESTFYARHPVRSAPDYWRKLRGAFLAAIVALAGIASACSLAGMSESAPRCEYLEYGQGRTHGQARIAYAVSPAGDGTCG